MACVTNEQLEQWAEALREVAQRVRQRSGGTLEAEALRTEQIAEELLIKGRDSEIGLE